MKLIHIALFLCSSNTKGFGDQFSTIYIWRFKCRFGAHFGLAWRLPKLNVYDRMIFRNIQLNGKPCISISGADIATLLSTHFTECDMPCVYCYIININYLMRHQCINLRLILTSCAISSMHFGIWCKILYFSY